MAVKAGTAFVDIEGRFDKLQRQLASQSGPLSKQGRGLGSKLGSSIAHGATIAAKAGAVGVAAGLVYAVKKASDFEGQLSTLESVTDANAKTMDRFRRQALKAGADTKFSALEAAAAQTELAKGGLKVQQIMRGGLKSALALAAAGEMDLADAAETTVNAMKLFGLRGKDSIKVADGLATAANRTTADVSDFSMALKMGGSAAKAAGLNFNATVTALEALAEIGIKGSDAGTSLKAMLTQLAKPTAASAELMDKLGISFFDAEGNMKSLPRVAAMLQSKLGGLTREQRLSAATTLAGTDGMRALLALYDAGPQKLRKFSGELNKQGTAAQVAKKRQDNLKGSWEQLTGSLETLGISVGTMAIPAIREATDELTGLTNKITPIFSRKDLDLGEKLQRAFDVSKVEAKPWLDKLKAAIDEADLPEKIAAVLSAATPKVAEAVAAAAPKAAGAFIQAFTASNLWGQLVIGGLLLRKMGGLAAFTALGRKAGGAFGTGMATGAGNRGPIAPGAAGAPAAGAAGSAQKGGTPWAASVSRGGAAASVGGTLALMGGIKALSDSIAGATQTDIGLLNEYADAIGRVAKSGNADGMRDLAGKLRETARANQDVTKGEHLEMFARALEATATSGGKDLSALQGAFKALGKTTGSELPKVREQLGELPKQSKAVDTALERMKSGSSKSIRSLRTNVKLNTRLIKNHLGDDTEAGKDALAKNFQAAVQNVRQSMKEGTISTERGTAEIERLMVAALQNLGFSKKQALSLRKLKGQNPGGNLSTDASGGIRPNQQGGYYQFGRPGDVGPDSILARVGAQNIAVAPGEVAAVFNRHQLPIVNQRLADMGGLPGLFKKVTRPHQYARGGMVRVPGDPDTTGGRDLVNPAIANQVAAFIRRFGVQVNYAYDPGHHQSAGHNVTGTALDIGPWKTGWDGVDRAVAAAVQAGKTVYYDGRFGSTALSNHGRGNHAHIEWGMGGAVAGAMAAAVPDLARMIVDGPTSPLRALVQQSLDVTRAAAQDRLRRMADTTGPEGAELGIGGEGSGRELMESIARARGWSFADWWELDGRETGHGVNLVNPTSTARLRGQFLDSNWGKYGPGSDPRQNPSMDEQIRSMAAYIADRYGNPTAALAFHNAHNFYGLGGLVGFQGGGLPAGIDRLSRRLQAPKVKHGKKMRRNTPKLRRQAVNKLLDRVKDAGVPDGTMRRLSKLSDEANKFGEFAARAEALTVQPPDFVDPVTGETVTPDPVAGLVDGKDQLYWLREQLTKLFEYRNQLVDAYDLVEKRREKIREAIDRARQRLGELNTALGSLSRQRKPLEKELEKLRDKKKPTTADRARIKKLVPQIAGLKSNERNTLAARDLLRDRVLDGLKDQRGKLSTARGDILSGLETIQGFPTLTDPMQRLEKLPDLGVLGGTIGDVQLQIRDITTEKPEIVDDSDARERTDLVNSLLRDQLRDANLRAAVASKQFDVLSGWMPPYGGSFADGGVIPGPVGAPRTIIGHGGEVVLNPEQQDALGDTRVILDLRGGLEMFERFIDVRVERASRTQSRRATRALPGGGSR